MSLSPERENELRREENIRLYKRLDTEPAEAYARGRADGLREAIEAVESQQRRWLKASERLPTLEAPFAKFSALRMVASHLRRLAAGATSKGTK